MNLVQGVITVVVRKEKEFVMRNIMKHIKRSIIVMLAMLCCYVTFIGAPLIVEATADQEEFKFEVTVEGIGDEDLTFYVPTSGYLGNGYDKEYSWNIDWGDGKNEECTHADSANAKDSAGIKHIYTESGTYEITITPNDSDDAWLGAFGFSQMSAAQMSAADGANTETNRKKVTKVISPLTVKMTRTKEQIANEEAPEYEWSNTFFRCVNITMGEDFNLPQDLTSVGHGFAYYMFYSCSGDSFAMNDNFNLPQGITRVGNNFAFYMFFDCSGDSFTISENFNLPQDLEKVGNNFAYYMFRECNGASFTMSENFNLPQGITSVGTSFASDMFYGCNGDSFTMSEGFNFPQGIATAKINFAYNMFYGCNGASFTMSENFNLPQGITSTEQNFAHSMFSGCNGDAFTMGENFNLPQRITSVGDDFARSMFLGCTGDSFTMSKDFNLPQDLEKFLEVKSGSKGDNFAHSMFSSCSGDSFTMNKNFNLPQKLTSVGINFAYSMFKDCTGDSFTMSENFNLPQNLTSVGGSFANSMFHGCRGASFIVNDKFVFPKLQTESIIFADTFNGVTTPQYRTAHSIINGNNTPSSGISSFSNAFPDISYIDINWGGEGNLYSEYGVELRILRNVFPDVTIGYTDKGAAIIYIFNLGTKDITGITPIFESDDALSDNALSDDAFQVGTISKDTIQTNEWATIEIVPKDQLNAGTYETNVQITWDNMDAYALSDELEASLTIPLKQVVHKAIPTYTEPTGLTATVGQTLKDVTLPDGFTWKTPNTSVGEIGTRKFTAIFTPKDTMNYEIVEVSLDVVTLDAVTPDKKHQSQLSITGVGQILSLGKEVTLTVVGGSGSGKVSYKVTKGEKLVTLNQETGKLLAVGIGTVEITATKAGDAAYKDAAAAVTIQVTMPNKNETIIVGGNKYKVTSTTNKKETLSYLGATNKNAAKVTIPATIKIGGKSYKVTNVANNAFKNFKKLKSVTIGKNVTAIGNNAFSGCKSLTKITIPANVKTIGTKAFYNASKLKTITVKSKKLTKVGKNAFKGIHKKATIKVPSSKLKAYKRLLKGKGQAKSVVIKK